MKRLWTALPFLICLIAWQLLFLLNGGRVIPAPSETFMALARILSQPDAWLEIAATLSRGAGGLALGSLAGILAGIAVGRHPHFMDAITPVVTLVQSCPPIVWISMLLVWLSVGGIVPLMVTFLSVVPVLFITTANAVRALDERWFDVAHIYRIPYLKQLRKIILPGIAQGLAAGFSYAFGIAWKVTATAEFFGAPNGIGARIFNNYRNLNLPELFAWTLVIAILGITLETTVVRKLRK
ncbi:MAG: ABC transporter permease subunit [Lentisphaeria bacterium]|nr:ABC transporter permease subunit [Lentisphaeria bacterium]